mgnify:CR=1 FL=1
MSDKEAKERMKAWKVLPEDDRPSWEAFKRQWQRRKDVECDDDEQVKQIHDEGVDK